MNERHKVPVEVTVHVSAVVYVSPGEDAQALLLKRLRDTVTRPQVRTLQLQVLADCTSIGEPLAPEMKEHPMFDAWSPEKRIDIATQILTRVLQRLEAERSRLFHERINIDVAIHVLNDHAQALTDNQREINNALGLTQPAVP